MGSCVRRPSFYVQLKPPFTNVNSPRKARPLVPLPFFIFISLTCSPRKRGSLHVQPGPETFVSPDCIETRMKSDICHIENRSKENRRDRDRSNFQRDNRTNGWRLKRHDRTSAVIVDKFCPYPFYPRKLTNCITNEIRLNHTTGHRYTSPFDKPCRIRAYMHARTLIVANVYQRIVIKLNDYFCSPCCIALTNDSLSAILHMHIITCC